MVSVVGWQYCLIQCYTLHGKRVNHFTNLFLNFTPPYMSYYKNAELAELYGVSRRTITNWVSSARQGRVNLQLQEVEGTYYIAKTSSNQQVMVQMTQERRKFLNTRSLKVATPKPEFYELYSTAQILDIISNIDIHREMPRQYNYFDGGAQYWDKYAERLHDEDAPNLLRSTIELLSTSTDYLDHHLADYKQVNVIDVGVGNALPIKGLLNHLLQKKKLGRYVAIDISDEMLGIAEQHLKEWFGGHVPVEGYVRDINYERFADVLLNPPSGHHTENSMNLVLLLGGTLSNFRAPEDVVKIIYNSMGRHDLFVYTVKLDSEITRRHFDFHTGSDSQLLPPQYKFIVDLLGIEESYYDVETGYDAPIKARYLRIRLKVALSLPFILPHRKWRLDLKKDDTILLWRAKQGSTFEVLNQLHVGGMNPLLMSQTADHDYMMVVADMRMDGR